MPYIDNLKVVADTKAKRLKNQVTAVDQFKDYSN